MYDKREKPVVSTRITLEEIKSLPCLRVPDHVPLESAIHFEIRSEVSEVDGKSVERTYFPYYSQDNKLVGYKVRDWTKPKNEKFHFSTVGNVSAQCKMFGAHKAGDGAKKTIIVEGETDCAVAWYVIDKYCKSKGIKQSYAVVSLPAGCANAKISAKANQKFLLNCEELVLALDNDERLPGEKMNVVRGKEATEDIYSVLLSAKIKQYTYPEGFKDARDYATDCLTRGAEQEFYQAMLYGGQRYAGSKLVSPSKYTFEEMEEPIPEGVYIKEFPKLMEKFRGIRKYEMGMVTAPSGAGKSSVVTAFAGGLAEEGEKVGVIYLEEEDKDTLKRFQAYKLQVPFDDLFFNPKECKTEEERRAAWDWVCEKEEDGSDKRFVLMNHFGSLETKELMDKITQLVYIHRCTYIILDHVSLVVSGRDSDNDRKDLDILLTNLASFVAVNPVGIIAVSHINRAGSVGSGPAKGKEEQSYWIEVKKEHLRGSSAIEGLCWWIVGIEPEIMPDRSRGRIRLVSLKNRKGKKLGVADVTKMNETTGVFEDASGQDNVANF